jgi:hypothetical protein
MAMAPGGTEGSRRLWAKGRGKEREGRDGWACWASVADYHIYIGWFLAHGWAGWAYLACLACFVFSSFSCRSIWFLFRI